MGLPMDMEFRPDVNRESAIPRTNRITFEHNIYLKKRGICSFRRKEGRKCFI